MSAPSLFKWRHFLPDVILRLGPLVLSLRLELLPLPFDKEVRRRNIPPPTLRLDVSFIDSRLYHSSVASEDESACPVRERILGLNG